LELVVISSSAIATAPTVRVIVAVNKISFVNSAIQPRYIPPVPSTSCIFAPRATTFPMQVDAFGLRAP
jgi:hypothetical protein